MVATWKPDPSFYPSPRMAMKAPAETLAYVAAFDPNRKNPDVYRRRRRRSRLRRYWRRSSRRWTCPMPATSCTISAGTPARPACAPTRRIPMSSAAIWSFRACARRASTSSTPSRIRAHPKIVKVIEPEEVAEKRRLLPPAYGPLRSGRHLRHRARQCRGQGPGRDLPAWIPRPSMCAANGRSTAVRSSSPMMPGGISATTPW